MNTIHLNGKRAFDAESSCVVYDAVLDGKSVPCAISRDALQYYFQDMGDPLETFDSNKMVILYFTKRVLDRHGCVDGEPVVIGQDDMMRGA
jgi:hypothetical protein